MVIDTSFFSACAKDTYNKIYMQCCGALFFLRVAGVWDLKGGGDNLFGVGLNC